MSPAFTLLIFDVRNYFPIVLHKLEIIDNNSLVMKVGKFLFDCCLQTERALKSTISARGMCSVYRRDTDGNHAYLHLNRRELISHIRLKTEL